MIKVTEHISIHENEIHMDFIRAQGPGGQNVNKVATAVQLRFDVLNSPSLPEEVRLRLKMLAGKRMTEEGIVIIEARRFRTQEKNRKDAIEKLVALIQNAAVKPKKRKKTAPSAASREQVLKFKRIRSQVKKLRRPVSPTADD